METTVEAAISPVDSHISKLAAAEEECVHRHISVDVPAKRIDQSQPEKTPAPVAADRKTRLNHLAQELNAVKRLDELFTPEAEPATDATSKIEANPQKETKSKDHVEREAAPVVNASVSVSESAARRSNSTRGVTRSAFESLRANLAGSLELTRMQPRSNSNRRRAPPLPDQKPVVSLQPEAAPVAETTPLAETAAVKSTNGPILGQMEQRHDEQVRSDKELENEDEEEERAVSLPMFETSARSHHDRSRSTSPMPRSASICFEPQGFNERIDASSSSIGGEGMNPRSISLSRVEPIRSSPSSKVGLAPKPPSFRRILKERAVQLFQLNDTAAAAAGAATAKTQTAADTRLSRSDQFIAAADESKPRRFKNFRKVPN